MTRILFLCRANRCRSPFAAALFERALGIRSVDVESAGLLPGGHPMPTDGLTLGREVGFDFARHRSREYDPHLYDPFDVILTTSRDQSRDIVASHPDLFPRVFTIGQFADHLRDHQAPSDTPLGDWLDRMGRARDRSSLLDAVPEDGIVDPFGRGPAVWKQMYGQLQPAVMQIAERLAPALQAR